MLQNALKSKNALAQACSQMPVNSFVLHDNSYVSDDNLPLFIFMVVEELFDLLLPKLTLVLGVPLHGLHLINAVTLLRQELLEGQEDVGGRRRSHPLWATPHTLPVWEVHTEQSKTSKSS